MEAGMNSKELISKAMRMVDNIVNIIQYFKSSKKTLVAIKELLIQSNTHFQFMIDNYEIHSQTYEQIAFRKILNQYLDLLYSILPCLRSLEKNGRFMRLVYKDKSKLIVKELLDDITLTVYQLRQICFIENKIRCVGDKLGEMNQGEVDKINKLSRRLTTAANKIKTMHSTLDDSAQKKSNIMNGIELAKQGSLGILKGIEIGFQDVKSIPGLSSIRGDRNLIIRRKYQGISVIERCYDNFESLKTQESLKKEVAVLNQLTGCKNILKIYGMRIVGSQAGLIMEFCSKGSLRQLIDKGTLKNDISLKVKFMRSLIEGVGYLHEFNFVHRNLSTSNILITKDFTLKLSGFEFTREINMYATMISMEHDVNRCRWIPPENFDPNLKFTSKGDIYSLGMILWAIWAESYPYKLTKDIDKVQKYIKNGVREDLSEFPSDLKELIIKCWESEEDNRPTSEEVLSEVENLFSHIKIEDDELKQDSLAEVYQLGRGPKNNNMREIIDLNEVNSKEEFYRLVDESNAKQISNDYLHSMQDIDHDYRMSLEPPMHSQINELSDSHMASALKLHYSNQKDLAFTKFQELGSFGHIDAFYYLGYYHYWGVTDINPPVPKNIPKALTYIELAATSGNLDALDFLGNHFYAQAELNRERTLFIKAVKYFTQAADRAHPKGLFHLGTCYIKGQGVQVDIKKGISLVEKASSLGNSSATRALKKLKQ